MKKRLLAAFEPLRPFLRREVAREVVATVRREADAIQREFAQPHVRPPPKVPPPDADVAVVLAWVAFFSKSVRRRRVALARLKAMAPLAVASVPEPFPAAVWEYARCVACFRDTPVVADALRVALAYDRDCLLRASDPTATLDEFMAPSLSTEVRGLALQRLVEVGGWGAFERATLLPNAEGERRSLLRAFERLLTHRRRLEDLSPTGFELLAAQLLRAENPGVCVTVVGRVHDRGVDLVLSDEPPAPPRRWPAKPRYVVQCKRWRDRVSLREAIPLLVAALRYEADAIFVTSSRYRQEHLRADLLSLPGLSHRADTRGRPGVTLRVETRWIRAERARQDDPLPLAENPREHIELRLIERDDLRKMMPSDLAAAYDFSDP